ncbi:hypothetical protein [Vibrio phage JSF12]|uniref:Lipoprotein n=2 Tax=Jesfedecavirus TaxID=2560156 RepID=A0A2D0Z3P5_9CAUD|nr:hypothetical protein FDI98_gp131 [Vibrio phage JSF10]YP_009794711.1 hypothetical protein HOS35_gp028 [Vibrio phage JSF12]ASV43401.1 hypothetical protein [Vibrio phage JSF10]ASV43546.1 hypothetical protein [Vibrio phage JSF12]
MMKKIAIALACIFLVACEAEVVDSTRKWELPHDLRDCRVVELTKEGFTSSTLVLIKCPEGYIGASHNYTTNGGKNSHSVQSVVTTE